MTGYAELQVTAGASQPTLKVALPETILRAAAIRPDDGWRTLLVQAIRHLRPPGAAAFLAALEEQGSRAAVTFILPARQDGDPPAEVVRWIGDTDVAAA
ncbi:hypothetical protein [Desertibaculum subflavum]|uniref:hypothetical protein n=1 Tax=Desertibaculum subflavum TaxID=2268458 RepID=UPI0013C47461